MTTAGALAGMTASSTLWLSSPVLMYAFYVAHTAMSGFGRPAHDAMIIDLTPQRQRKAVYSINYWSVNAALATGALVGSFLYTDLFGALLLGCTGLTVFVSIGTYMFLSETAPTSRHRQPDDARWHYLVGGYAEALRDHAFLRLLIAFTLVLGVEMQLAGYIGVKLADSVRSQTLLTVSDWHFHVNGIELLGVLRAENTVLVVLLAMLVERSFGRVRDNTRIYLGLGLFVGSYVVLAVTNAALVLIVTVFVLTVGELLHIPVMQALLAEIVPDDGRTKYMALFNLNVRGGMILASLGVSLGAIFDPWQMAIVYVALGGCAALLYRSILDSQRSPVRSMTP